MGTKENENINENENENNNVNEVEQLKAQIAELQNNYNSVVGEKESLINKNDELIGKNKKITEKLEGFSKIASDEEDERFLKEGNAEALFNKRLAAQQAQFDEIVANMNKEKDELHNKVTSFENQMKRNEFEKKALEFVSKADIKKSATKMFIDHMMNNATLENGEFVFKDANGNVKHNAAGQKFSANDFIEEQRSVNDFFYETQQGTDAKKGSGNGKTKTYSRKQWDLALYDATEEQAAALRQEYAAGNITIV